MLRTPDRSVRPSRSLMSMGMENSMKTAKQVLIDAGFKYLGEKNEMHYFDADFDLVEKELRNSGLNGWQIIEVENKVSGGFCICLI